MNFILRPKVVTVTAAVQEMAFPPLPPVLWQWPELAWYVTRILNQMLHPTVILLTIVILCLLLNIFMCIRVRKLATQVTTLLQTPTYIYNLA